MNDKFRLGVVLLNYMSYLQTIQIVENLKLQSIAPSIFIVIVDNASPNDSLKYLRELEEMDDIKIISSKINLGYAKGNNIGITYLESYVHPKYIAILNNDIIIKKDCFEKLIDIYPKLNKAAIIAPLMLDPNGVEQIPGKLNNFLEDCVSLFICFNKLYRNKNASIKPNTATMKVDLIPGSFMFSDFNRFKEIGYFYPGTFLYGEETFIAQAVKNKRMYNYIILDLSYIHAHRSPTISKSYSTAGKYSLVIDSMIKYTLQYRSYPHLKSMIIKALKPISLFEKYIYDFIKIHKL